MGLKDISVADIKVNTRHRTRLQDIESLAESISRLGLLNPITLRTDYTLVAGHRRMNACKMLGWESIPAQIVSLDDKDAELAEIDENLMRDDLTVLERGEHLARRKEIYEELHPETKRGSQGRRGSGAGEYISKNEIISFSDDTAEKTGVTPRTVQQEVQIANALSDEVKDLIRDMPLADVKTDLLQLSRLEPEQQLKVAEMIASGEAKAVMDARRLVNREDMQSRPMPTDKYRVIYADPPWRYNDSGVINDDNYGRAERHYPTMSMEELCMLPITTLTNDSAVLFLWVTSPLIEESFRVIRAWGFEYKACFVWDKVRHNMGHYNSVRHEFLLICTKGSCLPDSGKLHDSVVEIERSEKHSEKPKEFRELIDGMYPTGKRIELFARGDLAAGWETWGNE